jgi:hypothetical protein
VYAHTHGSRRGQQRPGAAPVIPAIEDVKEEIPGVIPLAVPVRLSPAPLPPLPARVPVLKRKPLLVFGAAAALGAVAGVVFRLKPEFLFHHSKPGLFSRLKLR